MVTSVARVSVLLTRFEDISNQHAWAGTTDEALTEAWELVTKSCPVVGNLVYMVCTSDLIKFDDATGEVSHVAERAMGFGEFVLHFRQRFEAND